VGNVEFYVTHSPQASASHFDLCGAGDAPEIWGPLVFTGAATKSLVLQGMDLLPNEEVTVYFRASAGATTALIGIEALAFESFGSNVDVATGDIEITAGNVQLSTALLDNLVLQEDDAHVDGEAGVLPLAVRNDTLASLVDTDGDRAPLQVNATGAVYSEVTAMPGGMTGYAEDSVHVDGDIGMFALAVRNDTLASLCDTDGDRAVLQVNANGALYTIDETANASLAIIDDAVYADDAAWTDDVSKHTLAGGLYQSTPQTVTDGRVAPIQVDSNGNIIESNSAAILAKMPALGTAVMAASDPVTIATDDTQFGAIGSASDVDGNIHGQLRFSGEKLNTIDTSANDIKQMVYADDGTWINDLSFHSLVGGLYQSLPQTITDGKVGPIQVDVNGNVKVVNPNKGILVSNATGAAAIDIDTAFAADWELLSITLHLSAAATTSENLTIVLDANDGAAYDTTLFTLDLSVSAGTDFVLTPEDDNLPKFYESGDELNIDFPNTETNTYGVRVVYRLV
jgi:hypothetical protein